MASYLETAIDIAREAGALLSTYFERRVAFELKGEFDLVTEADRASERLVVERLRSHFPAHSIVAEEGGGRDVGGAVQDQQTPADGKPRAGKTQGCKRDVGRTPRRLGRELIGKELCKLPRIAELRGATLCDVVSRLRQDPRALPSANADAQRPAATRPGRKRACRSK